MRRKLFGEQHLDVARSLYSLNRVYEKKGDLKTAEALAIDSLAINIALTGTDSLETAGSLCRLGVILHAQGRARRARERRLERVPAHPRRAARAGSRGDHGAARQPGADRAGRVATSSRPSGCTARRCASTAHARQGPSAVHPPPAQSGDGDARAAATSTAPSRCIARPSPCTARVLGPEHSETHRRDAATSGRLLMERGRFDEAQQVYDDCAGREPQGASRAARRRRQRRSANLGRLALARKQYRRSRAALSRSAAGSIARRCRPATVTRPAALTMLGRAQLELSRPQEAEETLQARAGRVVEGLRRKQRLYALARAVSRHGRGPLQRRFARSRSRRCSRRYPVLVRARLSEQLTATVRRWIEELYRATGRPQQAQAYFQQVQAQDRAARSTIALSSGSRARPQSRKIRSLARHPPTRAEVQGELPCEFSLPTIRRPCPRRCRTCSDARRSGSLRTRPRASRA